MITPPTRWTQVRYGSIGTFRCFTSRQVSTTMSRIGSGSSAVKIPLTHSQYSEDPSQ
jgi:hypothetical protein